MIAQAGESNDIRAELQAEEEYGGEPVGRVHEKLLHTAEHLLWAVIIRASDLEEQRTVRLALPYLFSKSLREEWLLLHTHTPNIIHIHVLVHCNQTTQEKRFQAV